MEITVTTVNSSPLPICIINAYMPSTNYKELVKKYMYNDAYQIVFCGDMN